MSDTVQVLKRSVLLRTVDGEKLLAMATAIEVGGTLSYEHVKAALGIDLQAPAGRQLWQRAQQHLAAEKHYQFTCIPRVGYQRLDDDGKVDKSGKFIGQAVRRVRAAGRVIVTTDRAKLSAPKQLAHDVQNAVIGAMQTAARPAIVATRATPLDRAELDKVLEGVRALG
jgi:hypothetical protein